MIREALGLFPSVIKSGESWTETCQKVLEGAYNELDQRVIKDGKVAFIYSSYSSGWSTVEVDPKRKKEKVFCPRLVRAILKLSKEDPNLVAQELFGESNDFEICWVPIGNMAAITLHKGHESINHWPLINEYQA